MKHTFKAICLSMLAGPEAIPSSFTTRIQEGGHKPRCRKPNWMGIPSVRLLPTPQLCEQIVGRLDIAEGHQKLPQGVIVQRIRLIGVTV